jgi:hypothetical protein
LGKALFQWLAFERTPTALLFVQGDVAYVLQAGVIPHHNKVMVHSKTPEIFFKLPATESPGRIDLASGGLQLSLIQQWYNQSLRPNQIFHASTPRMIMRCSISSAFHAFLDDNVATSA